MTDVNVNDDGEQPGEAFDEDLIGRDDAVTSDQVGIDYPPDRPLGIPFADADVTDESVADRHAREEPEVWEQRRPRRSESSAAADEQLEQIVELE